MLTPTVRLLVIDDDMVDRRAVARAVKTLGARYELTEAREGRAGIELATSQAFDCILVDYNLPDMNGLDLLAELRARLGIATPIVMLTGSGNESIAVEAMKRGAQDYLPKTRFDAAILSRVVGNVIEKCALQKDLAESQQNLEHLALYDTLTGLGNRNLFNIEIARSVAAARRKATSFALLMMDLDKFKTVNDAFGHEAGDSILAETGRRLRLIARASDAYFRIGGDEFTAILDAGSDGNTVVERIARVIAEPVVYGPHALAVDVSIGVAMFPANGQSARDLIRAADAAMYSIKKADPGPEPTGFPAAQ